MILFVGNEEILVYLLALDLERGAREGKAEARLRAHKGPRFGLMLARLALPISATPRKERKGDSPKWAILTLTRCNNGKRRATRTQKPSLDMPILQTLATIRNVPR